MPKSSALVGGRQVRAAVFCVLFEGFYKAGAHWLFVFCSEVEGFDKGGAHWLFIGLLSPVRVRRLKGLLV